MYLCGFARRFSAFRDADPDDWRKGEGGVDWRVALRSICVLLADRVIEKQLICFCILYR